MEEARKDHLNAFQIYEMRGDLYRASVAASNLAGVSVRLGLFPETELYLERSDNFARKSGMSEVLVENLRIRSDLQASRGNHALALRTYQLHIRKKDSMESSDRKERLDNLLMVYKSQQSDQQIALLESENAAIEALQEKEHAEHLERRSYLFASLTGGGLLLTLIIGLLYISVINRRKRTQLGEKNQELADKNNQLHELNEEHLNLIQIVAHDLKAPLNKTLGLVNLMGASGNLSPEQIKFISMLKKVNQDAGHLLRELLELNALESGPDPDQAGTEEYYGGQLLEEIVKEFGEVAVQKQIRLILHQPAEPVKINGRPDYLQRVMDNLISNALKFSPYDRQIDIGLVNNGSLRFWVQDEGPGISEEDQKMLFRKFQRLSAKPTGGESSTGLGLSIVKNLVDKMGGRIEVESNLGQGTKFQVILPGVRDERLF